MNLFEKEECCGCTACYSICPRSAIVMERDEEGFYYPSVIEEKCINCHLCEQVCSFKRKMQSVKGSFPSVYAARINDKEILKNSSSGGMFTVLSDVFLEEGNAVVCSIYDSEKYIVKYCLILNSIERDKARGSKYLKSDPGQIFKEVEEWLKDNPTKQVVFFGMGCEVDGFNSYSKSKNFRDRVTLVDIICHGGSSPLIWSKYAQMYESKQDSKITLLDFKNKQIDWYHPVPLAVFANGLKQSISEYVNIFNSACAYRPSCYSCPYTNVIRDSDITIGDFWGIEKTHPDFYQPMGNSVILIHSNQGKDLFNKVKSRLCVVESNLEECKQPNLYKPTEKPKNRDAFWSKMQEKGIRYVVKRYGKLSVAYRIKRRIRKLIGL